MGQKDPLAEWQREGYDMFSAMMDLTQDNFVRYVSHLQVVADDAPRQGPRNVRYSAAEDPVQGSGALRAAAASGPPPDLGGGGVGGNGDMGGGAGMLEGGAMAPAPAELPPEDVPQQPVRVEKTPGRNEPCYCGSGKKFKLCHGR